MNLMSIADIETRGIRAMHFEATHALYQNMVRWGWIDGFARPRTWDHWQKQAPKYFAKERD